MLTHIERIVDGAGFVIQVLATSNLGKSLNCLSDDSRRHALACPNDLVIPYLPKVGELRRIEAMLIDTERFH